MAVNFCLSFDLLNKRRGFLLFWISGAPSSSLFLRNGFRCVRLRVAMLACGWGSESTGSVTVSLVPVPESWLFSLLSLPTSMLFFAIEGPPFSVVEGEGIVSACLGIWIFCNRRFCSLGVVTKFSDWVVLVLAAFSSSSSVMACPFERILPKGFQLGGPSGSSYQASRFAAERYLSVSRMVSLIEPVSKH